MKKVQIEKNKLWLRLEFSDLPCAEILHGSSRYLRFDIVHSDDDEILSSWRAVVEMGDDDLPVLELKDYRDNERSLYPLSATDTLSDATAIALRIVWGILDEEDGLEPDDTIVPEEPS